MIDRARHRYRHGLAHRVALVNPGMKKKSNTQLLEMLGHVAEGLGDGARQALVLRHPTGFWGSLQDVQQANPQGIDPRHAVWIWRRMLEVLAGSYQHGIGVDSSREMLAVARSRLASAGIVHAQVRLGDIAELDPAMGMADVIVIHQVLHYFDDPGRMLAQARRLLKPGGELLIVDFAPHDLEFLRTEHAHRRLGLSQGQMNAWAAAADLEVEAVSEFPGTTDKTSLTVCLWRLRDPN